jgi:hypothetical protein
MKKSTFMVIVAMLLIITSLTLNFSGWVSHFEPITYFVVVYGLLMSGFLSFAVAFEIKIRKENY